MGRARILVADDNRQVRASLRAVFAGHEKLEVCYEAADGREAVEQATRLRPHLVILDFMMPLMNGLEAAERIAKLTPAIPVILCTLHADIFARNNRDYPGVSRVVSKIEIDTLVKHAEELVSAA
jgi:CheY-like chemotaxis protein